MLDTTIAVAQHQQFRRTLPILSTLAHNVAQIHGEEDPELVRLAILLDTISELLVAQIESEERDLFADLRHEPVPPRVGAALAQMLEEHAAIAKHLRELRDAAQNFRAPSWAGPAYRVLLDGLARFEADLLRHQRQEDRELLSRYLRVEHPLHS